MLGTKQKKATCRECQHSNTAIFGPKTPVCYEIAKQEGKPVAKIIDLRKPACFSFKAKS